MPVLRNIHKNVRLALGLGACALTLNLAMRWVSGETSLPLGNIFLYFSAMVFGLPGAMMAFAAGVIPEVLYFSEWAELLRLFTICAALGLVSERYPRLPAQLVTLALWYGVFLPLSILSPGTLPGFLSTSNFMTAMLMAVLEISLVTICSVALLNPYVYGFMTGKPRQSSFGDVLMHAFNLVTALTVFAVLLASGPLEITAPAGEALMLIIVLACLALPAVAAWKLQHNIMANFQQYFAANLMQQTMSPGFSGLSSDFWRRKTLTNLRSLGPDFQPASPAGQRQQAPAALASGALAICALNRNGTIAFINEAFREVSGLTTNEVIGRRIDSIGLNPELARHLMELVEKTFTSGPRIMELKLNQLPDKLRYFEMSSQQSDASRERKPDDGPDSVIVTLRDITDRRSVEWHLLQAQRLSSLGNVISGIAHAFNNTLTAISGYASYARQINDLGQIHDSLNGIVLSVNKAGEMVHQLLDYADGKPTPMKTEDFGQAVEERLDLLRKMVGEGCEITYHKPASPLGARCDMNLIMQALTNLTLNAKESYGGKSGRIEISLEREHMDEDISFLHIGAAPGDYVRMQIRDYGFGMSRENLARAFDPLFTTKAVGGHTGIGLSIVYAIVRAHDGFLSVESHPEKGTTISVYLPWRELQEERLVDNKPAGELMPLTASIPAELQGHDESILVVEDEPYVRELVERMLKTLGYRVSSCADGHAALEKQRLEHFDLVLIDMIMPRMNGWELISRMRECASTARALVMTGYGAVPNKPDDDTGIIAKPFDLDTLARAIKESLAHAALQSGEAAALN